MASILITQQPQPGRYCVNFFAWTGAKATGSYEQLEAYQ